MQDVAAEITQPPTQTQVVMEGWYAGKTVVFTVHHNPNINAAQGTIGFRCASIDATTAQMTSLASHSVSDTVTIRWNGGYVMNNVAFL